MERSKAATERMAETGAAPTGVTAEAGAPGDPDAISPGDLTGIIYDIQGFSVQDGPGIRTTVFLKGCPLRCPWCHSPESQRFDIQLSWQARKCIGMELCGLCLSACPRGALGPGDATSTPVTGGAAGGGGLQLIRVDWDACDDCGACAEACPSGALSMWGKEYTVAEVVDRVLRDRPFFEKSGGGVTISGGEPFSQSKFTLALLQTLKERGIHTAVDTTGYVSWEVIERALPYIDLFLLDLKGMDAASHKAAMGVPNELILENTRRVAAAGGTIQIRVPLIPHFNVSEEDAHALGRFVNGLGEAVTGVQLLPYHALGLPKLERIRHAGPALEAAPLSDEQVEGIRAILGGYDLNVTVH